MVEGAKLVGEARRHGVIEAVYLDVEAGAVERAEAAACAAAGATVLEVQAGALSRALEAVSPQPMAAVVATVDLNLAEVAATRPTLLVACVDVQDPGNLGTMLRSAGAAGVGAVLCCGGSVDVYNAKSVRSSAGAIFHLPVVVGDDAEAMLDEIGRWGLHRWATAADGATDYTAADLAAPAAIVVGNEAHGLPPGLPLDGTLRIPMSGPGESLNVATAMSVVCFEAARQRRPLPVR